MTTNHRQGDEMRSRRGPDATGPLERTAPDGGTGGGWSGQAPPGQLAALGRAIHDLREERKLTVEQVATGAALRPAFVEALEAGDLSPTFHVLVRIAASLGITLTELAARFERPSGKGRS